MPVVRVTAEYCELVDKPPSCLAHTDRTQLPANCINLLVDSQKEITCQESKDNDLVVLRYTV